MADPMPSMLEAATAIANRQYTAVELLDQCVSAIEARNERLNAFVHLDLDAARAAASDVDRRLAAGEPVGRLAGVPFGVKDLEDCAGMPTSQGSLLFLGDGPVAADSIHVARLRAADAIPLGKTNAPEFGTLQYTRSKALGVARNPWDPSRTPGGSSGGTAAAVAAGMIPFGTASDGGGSTRIPASFSGLVGMKASFGRVPAPSAGTSQTTSLGVEVTTVADAALHLDVTAGPHDADRTSLPPYGGSYLEAIEQLDVAGLRVGWSLDLGFAVVDPEVADLARGAAEVVAAAVGSPLVEVDVTLTDPVRTWLSGDAVGLWVDVAGRDAYPGRLDELTPFVAAALQASADRPVPTLVKALAAAAAAGRRRRRRLRGGRRAVDPDHRSARLRRRGTPAHHHRRGGPGVPLRCDAGRGHERAVHHAGQPVLEPGLLGAGRTVVGGPAGGPADHGSSPRRRRGAAPGPPVRAGPALAPPRPLPLIAPAAPAAGKPVRVGDVSRVAEVTGSRYGANLSRERRLSSR